MAHVFISYSHKDKAYVHRLQQGLQREGLDVWIDDRIDYGTEWPRVIQNHLDECDAFIVVVSENAYASKWVQNEVARADRKKKPIFPLLLQGDPWLSVEATQYVDVTDGCLPDEKFYQRLSLVMPRKDVEKEQATVRPTPKVNYRILGIGGIILFVLIFGGFGLNYLIKNLPVATAPTPFPTEPITAPTSLPTKIATSKPPASTNIPVTPTPQPTPTLGIGSTTVSEKDGMTLLYVPAGFFTMGSLDDYNEQPVHQVYLDAFWIDETEVTNEMYLKCMDAGKCDDLYNNKDRLGNSTYANHPVVYVSWYDATDYCSWAGLRLPTEAEWEKAASWNDQNQTKYIYPWGDAIDCSFANHAACVYDTTAVGSYESGKSPYGAYDMAGNVWEWVADWYDSEYYQYSPSPNPVGPDSARFKVLRGGSWNFSDYEARSANRYMGDALFTGNDAYIGFRCARSP